MLKPDTLEEALELLDTISKQYHKLAGECQVMVLKVEEEKMNMCENCRWKK